MMTPNNENSPHLLTPVHSVINNNINIPYENVPVEL